MAEYVPKNAKTKAKAKKPGLTFRSNPALVAKDLLKRGGARVYEASFKRAAKTLDEPVPKPSKSQLKFDSMPIVSVMERRDMDRAIALMSEDVECQEVEQTTALRRKEIKGELAALAIEYDLQSGFRYGTIGVYYNGSGTKKTLNISLLLENGVTPAQIEESYKESEPFVKLRVIDVSKPRSGARGDEDE
jgi:hypothetical protein